MIGTSYDGFTVLMGLIHPHPALKAAVPINPMVDTWKGDDWFHNGAFRQEMMDYVYSQEATRKSDRGLVHRRAYDDYDNYLRDGSAGALGKSMGMEQLGFWRKLQAHPAYDGFWQGQAMDKLLAAEPLKVPTLYVGGLWDQEDIYGAVAAYEATEPKDANNDMNYLVLGPWFHGQANGDGSKLGPLVWDGDTGYWFRLHVLQPFLDEHLKDGPKADIAPVTAYETGTRIWRRYQSWPLSCEQRLPLQGAEPLSAARRQARPSRRRRTGRRPSTSMSPIRPSPCRTASVRSARPMPRDRPGATGSRTTSAQFATRPDVLVYETDVLTAPVQISGQPVANLFASTTGTDADCRGQADRRLSRTRFPNTRRWAATSSRSSMDILRGRYRKDPAHPSPIPAGKVETYRFALPTTNHVFLPGTGSWCRSSRAGSRSTTATRRPMWTTSSSPSRRTTRRRRTRVPRAGRGQLRRAAGGGRQVTAILSSPSAQLWGRGTAERRWRGHAEAGWRQSFIPQGCGACPHHRFAVPLPHAFSAGEES